MRSKFARSRSSLLTKIIRGTPELGGDLPDRLGLHLDAVDRADHEHREVGHPQRGVDVADEVGVAGGVDQVDLVAVPLERRQGQRQARCRFCSSGSKSLTVVPSSTRPGRLIAPAREQQRLGQRRLAGSAWPTSATLRILGGG